MGKYFEVAKMGTKTDLDAGANAGVGRTRTPGVSRAVTVRKDLIMSDTPNPCTKPKAGTEAAGIPEFCTLIQSELGRISAQPNICSAIERAKQNHTAIWGSSD